MPGARPIGSPQLGGAALARRWYDAAAERAPWLYRSEVAGVLAAIFGLAALWWLSTHLSRTADAPTVPPMPMEITMADETAVQASAEQARLAPAQAEASERGPSQQAAPAPVIRPEPAPAPPQPPAPAPALRPAPAERTPPRFAPEAPAPRPVSRAQPRSKPAPAAPTPVRRTPTPTRPAPAAPTRSAQPSTRPAAAAPARTAQQSARPGNGASPGAAATRARASRLGSEIQLGQSDRPAPANAPAAQAQMTGQARQNIGMLIQRQVQPCASQQQVAGRGLGAERIRVSIRLHIGRDGSLVSRPTIIGSDGVDDDNRIYLDAVERATIATFVGCAPLRGLPPELYDVPQGWSTFQLRYRLPG